jgi:hypothetical protein
VLVNKIVEVEYFFLDAHNGTSFCYVTNCIDDCQFNLATIFNLREFLSNYLGLVMILSMLFDIKTIS